MDQQKHLLPNLVSGLLEKVSVAMSMWVMWSENSLPQLSSKLHRQPWCICADTHNS